jgi:DNA-binding response OmpR family regulator
VTMGPASLCTDGGSTFECCEVLPAHPERWRTASAAPTLEEGVHAPRPTMAPDASAPSARILLVEDDRKFAAQVRTYLEQQFFEVAVVHDGERAVAEILARAPDLVVLDLMLPGLDGIAILRRCRPQYGGRVLMLTASHAESDHVAGLEVGADDFVTKPVVPRILLARIRALLRREGPQSGPDTGPIHCGELTVDPATRDVRYRGTEVPLTGAEFDLIRLLAGRSGEVISRDVLCRQVRGVAYDGIDRAIDIHVARVRRKLEQAGAPRLLIKAVRGEGYVLAVRR